MGLFDRLRGGGETPARTITVNREVRTGQLVQLEGALLDLMDAMKEHRGFVTPGWQARHAAYLESVKAVRELRSTQFDWVQVSDIAFEIRPMIRGPVPEGQEKIGAAQERVMALARALSTPMDSELS